MKVLIAALSVLLLSGCGIFTKQLTRLVPKIEMPLPPEELMKPPQPLKTIVQPPSKVDMLEKAVDKAENTNKPK